METGKGHDPFKTLEFYFYLLKRNNFGPLKLTNTPVTLTPPIKYTQVPSIHKPNILAKLPDCRDYADTKHVGTNSTCHKNIGTT